MLNALDGTVGDGDLGITLLKAFRELDRIKGELPDDLGAAFMKGAGAVAKVSSSSFGTLLATGLIAAGKETKGVTAIPASDVSRLLEKAGAAMAARGRSSLGDKTVLDTLCRRRTGRRGQGRLPRHVRRRPCRPWTASSANTATSPTGSGAPASSAIGRSASTIPAWSPSRSWSRPSPRRADAQRAATRDCGCSRPPYRRSLRPLPVKAIRRSWKGGSL